MIFSAFRRAVTLILERIRQPIALEHIILSHREAKLKPKQVVISQTTKKPQNLKSVPLFSILEIGTIGALLMARARV